MAKKQYLDLAGLTTYDEQIKSYIDAADGKANASHTHNYAGSSSAGGAATSANKLNTNAGSATNPVYFANGVPVKTTYTLGKSVPSNAVFTDTHYASKNVVGSSTATSNTTSTLTNGNVYLNSVENGAVTSAHKISGSGATTVTTDTSGNIIISSTDNNTTYSAAGSSLGLVKSGGDVSISSGVITVNDDSHNHTIANVDNLQSSLDAKVPTSRTVNGKALSGNITLSASDVGADASGSANTALTSAKSYTDTVASGKASIANGQYTVTTAGTGSAYTATVPSITALTAGVSFIMIPHVVSASTAPTLNVNSLGAKNIKRRLSNLSTSLQNGYSNTWLAKGKPFRVTYDGTAWIVEGHEKPAATDMYGLNASITELNYCEGVTSNIQTQLDDKVDLTSDQTISGVKTFSNNLIATDINEDGYVHLASIEPYTSDAGDVATIASEDTMIRYAYDSALVGSQFGTIQGASTTERIGGSVIIGGEGGIVNSNNQVVMGKYNVADGEDTYALIVGNGTAGTPSNAMTVDWDGNIKANRFHVPNNHSFRTVNTDGTPVATIFVNPDNHLMIGSSDYPHLGNTAISAPNGVINLNSASNVNSTLNVTGAGSFASTLGVTGITTIEARIQPKTDNAVQLGTQNLRFMNVYCMKSTMATSDLNAKRNLAKIDDRYIELFDLIEPYAYYFTNGDRVHTGFISQYVEEAMKEVGLTAEELGFFCKDIKMEYFYDDDGNYIGEKEVYDEDGNPIYVYSLRYEEYIAIMAEKIKRLEKKYNSKLEELEKRLEALEA